MQSNYWCAYDFQMPNGVDQRSDNAIACPLPNGVDQRLDDEIDCTSRFYVHVQNTESFRVRYAESLNPFEQNTFKIFYSVDHVKNVDAKLSRSALSVLNLNFLTY